MGRSRFIYDFMMKWYKPFQIFEKLPFLPKDSRENTSAHIIPVEHVMERNHSTVLPLEIISALIEKADCAGIMAECLCRRGENCSAYPHDTGCLILGRSIRHLDPGLGVQVTADEALAHAKQAIEKGLYPMVVHNSFDAWIWGINYRSMLNVCFCCDCCCSVRHGVRKHKSDGFFENIHRLPGLEVTVDPDLCNGCNNCIEVCMAKAITVHGSRVKISGKKCKGCGQCAEACNEGAVIIKIDSSEKTINELKKHYTERTTVFGE
jgi:electron transport complex protein RnfB